MTNKTIDGVQVLSKKVIVDDRGKILHMLREKRDLFCVKKGLFGMVKRSMLHELVK